jgi:hypothetical protein
VAEDFLYGFEIAGAALGLVRVIRGAVLWS